MQEGGIPMVLAGFLSPAVKSIKLEKTAEVPEVSLHRFRLVDFFPGGFEFVAREPLDQVRQLSGG